MIVKHDWTEYKPWLNIVELELVVGVNKVVIDMRNIGMFEMNDFSEYYIKGLNDTVRVREAGYVIIEIHESQVADIEFLYKVKELFGIDRINVIFEDGHMEVFAVPDVEHQCYRITSIGDLRIEMGSSTKIYGLFTEQNLYYEHSTAYVFGRNYKEDEYGTLCLYNKEPHREEGTLADKIDHPEIIENKTNEFLDILGEIISCLGSKRVNKQRLIAIASIVDYMYAEDLHIHESTVLYSDRIENERINQFQMSDYIGREVHEPELKNLIQSLCKEYKNTKISTLIERVEEYMDIYYFGDFKEKSKTIDDEDLDTLLDDIDKMFSEGLDEEDEDIIIR